MYVVRAEPGMRDQVMAAAEEYLSQNRSRIVDRVRSFEEQKKRTYAGDIAMVKLLTAVIIVLTGVTGLGIVGTRLVQRHPASQTDRYAPCTGRHPVRYRALFHAGERADHVLGPGHRAGRNPGTELVPGHAVRSRPGTVLVPAARHGWRCGSWVNWRSCCRRAGQRTYRRQWQPEVFSELSTDKSLCGLEASRKDFCVPGSIPGTRYCSTILNIGDPPATRTLRWPNSNCSTRTSTSLIRDSLWFRTRVSFPNVIP